MSTQLLILTAAGIFIFGAICGWYWTCGYIYYKDLRKSNGPLKSFLNASVWIFGVVSDWRYR